MVRMRLLASLFVILLAACAAPAGVAPPSSTAASASVPPSATARPMPDLTPEPGTAWFGMNLDWANDSVDAASARLGTTPSVWVQFVSFPLDDGGRGNLDAYVEQLAAVDGIGLITIEPHDGLETVTPDTARELATLLDGYWQTSGVPTIVRFAHEMNGSWYPWGQQPDAYVDAFQTVADAVHELAPASAMAWAPNEGSGYPFTGGPYASADPTLDTDGDGEVTKLDDPYAPYWPGDDAVDWVGMSIYHWGVAYPWGENELPSDGKFRNLLTGQVIGAHDGEVQVPDFYATYAEGHGKPMGVFETAALFNPGRARAGRGGHQVRMVGTGHRSGAANDLPAARDAQLVRVAQGRARGRRGDRLATRGRSRHGARAPGVGPGGLAALRWPVRRLKPLARRSRPRSSRGSPC